MSLEKLHHITKIPKNAGISNSNVCPILSIFNANHLKFPNQQK